MKIGVHLSGTAPEVGGGYTFQTDVFSAFVELAGTRPETFIILCDSEAILDFVRQFRLPNNCKAVELLSLPLFSKVVRRLNEFVPPIGRFVRRCGRLERTAIREGVQFIWHVGGWTHEVTDIPYIATVWDVQHRTHPWLPEVSHSGSWEARETTHATFLARAAYVITGTETGMHELEFYFSIPHARVRLLPHPTPAFALLDTRSIATDIRSRYNLNGDYFIYPAQFWPHKNHVNLLHALGKLKHRFGYQPLLVLMGSDKGVKGFVKDTAKVLGMETQVCFPGFVPLDDLVALYREAVGLLYVSLSGPENLPPLEAFGLGCPVLASDIPGAREQFGESAILVPPLDFDAIAEGWYRLYADGGLRDRLIASGKKRAQSWTGLDYVAGVLAILDEFEPIRRCWP